MAASNQHNFETLKRSYTEAFTIHGKLFRIVNGHQKSRFYCEVHKKHINSVTVVVDQLVQIRQCKDIGHRCFSETKSIVVELLDGSREIGHIPAICIDPNEEMQYKCFLCDEDDAVCSHDYKHALLHLLTEHCGYDADSLDLKCPSCNFRGDCLDIIDHCQSVHKNGRHPLALGIGAIDLSLLFCRVNRGPAGRPGGTTCSLDMDILQLL
jgi:hypothetical protein